MNGRFITKPTDTLVKEVEHWLGFHDSDPIRLDVDELYHLVHDAEDVLLVAATASGENRMQDALDKILEQSAKLAPLCDLTSGETYILQFVDSPTNQMRVEEMAVRTEWISQLGVGHDVIWSVSRSEEQGDSITIRLAVRNLQMKV